KGANERSKWYFDSLRSTWKRWFLFNLSRERAKYLYQQWFDASWEAGAFSGTGSFDFWRLLPESPKIRDDQIISIEPRKALASIDWFVLRFLTGTLNLSVEARAKWMQMGFEDTMEAFGVLPDTPNA